MANTTLSTLGFHARADALQQYYGAPVVKQDTGFTYTFENFFHPFVGELIEKLNKESLAGMLDPGFHKELADKSVNFFDQNYDIINVPAGSELNLPKKSIDLEMGGAYAGYNWELLFHIPL